MRPVLVVVLVAVLAVGVYVAWSWSEGDGAVSSEQEGTSMGEEYDPDEEYVPTLEVTLYRNDAGDVYRADMYLEVSDPTFISYLFGTLSVADGGLPSGDKELKFEIYEGTQTNRKEHHLTSKRFNIAVPEARESTYDIEFPRLQLTDDRDPTSIHLWGFCYFEDELICQKHWSINPDDMSIAAG